MSEEETALVLREANVVISLPDGQVIKMTDSEALEVFRALRKLYGRKA